MRRFVSRFVSLAVMVSLLGIGLPQPAQAGMLPTDAGTKERIVNFLDRGDVRSQLESLGVNPAEAKARVASLTNDEAAQLAAKIDNLPAGGDAAGALIGALLIVFIVLLITDILGVTHVFPFTKSIK